MFLMLEWFPFTLELNSYNTLLKFLQSCCRFSKWSVHYCIGPSLLLHWSLGLKTCNLGYKHIESDSSTPSV
uniref:Uncharacterized protein n=1 Tax=Setaria italica TaxID=4555 RepID=K4APF9_SETIT